VCLKAPSLLDLKLAVTSHAMHVIREGWG